MKTFCNHVRSFMLVKHLKAKVSKPKETRRAKTLSSTDSLIRLKNHLVQGWNKVSIRIAESSSFNKPKSHVQITEGTATMPITNIVCLQNLLLGVVSHPSNLTMKYNITVKKKFTLQYGSAYSKVSTKGVYPRCLRSPNTWPMYGTYPAWTVNITVCGLIISAYHVIRSMPWAGHRRKSTFRRWPRLGKTRMWGIPTECRQFPVWNCRTFLLAKSFRRWVFESTRNLSQCIAFQSS